MHSFPHCPLSGIGVGPLCSVSPGVALGCTYLYCTAGLTLKHGVQMVALISLFVCLVFLIFGLQNTSPFRLISSVDSAGHLQV